LKEVKSGLDGYATTIFSLLQSEFLVMPKGDGFVGYPDFGKGYEALKRATSEFRSVDTESVMTAISKSPLAMIVLRAMLGFTPPEWAYVAAQRTGLELSQGFARSLDRGIRIGKFRLPLASNTLDHVRALVDTACELLNAPAPNVEPDRLHRLNKADTCQGTVSLTSLARIGVPYAMLPYERFLGRPFAGHRDSVSEIVGDSLESAIEDVLTKAGVSFRKTKRAERIPGLEQAPDFITPSEFNIQAVIEAKLTEDDGTARDKVSRIQHLAQLSQPEGASGPRRFEVIACISGRGFGARREDMKRLLLATRGKVFTFKTLDKLVESTRLREFKSL
jgi:hypothetical protein